MFFQTRFKMRHNYPFLCHYSSSCVSLQKALNASVLSQTLHEAKALSHRQVLPKVHAAEECPSCSLSWESGTNTWSKTWQHDPTYATGNTPFGLSKGRGGTRVRHAGGWWLLMISMLYVFGCIHNIKDRVESNTVIQTGSKRVRGGFALCNVTNTPTRLLRLWHVKRQTMVQLFGNDLDLKDQMHSWTITAACCVKLENGNRKCTLF